MGFFSKLIGASAAEPIEALGTAFDKLFTNDEERAKAEQILTKIRQRPQILNAEINKIEAQHRTIFVAGWRPFIGWVCGSALAYSFILRDLLTWAIAIYAPDIQPPPELAMEHLLSVLGSLLGLGGMRSFEKIKGRAK